MAFWVAVAGLAALSFAAATWYRSWLAARRRGRLVPALTAAASLAVLLWLGSRHWWLLLPTILYAVFVLVTRIAGPWVYLVWAAPAARLGMDELTEAMVDRLVTRPAYVARLECYDTYAILDCGYSWLDSFVGRNGLHFRYSGACIICAVQRGFEACEDAAGGALAGMAEEFRRQYAESPRFVVAFKMRPPAVLWQWGLRPGPLTIIPGDLCGEHQV